MSGVADARTLRILAKLNEAILVFQAVLIVVRYSVEYQNVVLSDGSTVRVL